MKKIAFTGHRLPKLPYQDETDPRCAKLKQRLFCEAQRHLQPDQTIYLSGMAKLRYQRNRTAAFYKMLELYPLADILAMEAGAFGDDRDGDKAVMDWLIAVFDDEALVLENYDGMDTGTVEQLLEIFRRVNRIDEKEQKQKKPADGAPGITLERAVAMIAAHLGVVDEEQINNMSWVFFDDVLRELGYKLNFEAVSNYAGNAFCEKSWDMIEKSNPFNIADRKNGSQAMSNLAGFFGKSSIRIMGGKTK